MNPSPSEDTGPRALGVAELVRLAELHQEEACRLLAQVRELVRCRDAIDGPHRAGPERVRWARLTDREREVADLLVRGMPNRTIAQVLGISERTVKNHLYVIYHKLGVTGRTQAVIVLLGGPPG
ncbi:DNA-binding response regulator [Actinoalloteichus sp. AHMU CJ021]|uniref:helix-turn-helix domain-containing protein n=1 Tax=Actinoalloteichus sp. AHMU CJ021 TaxID=2072503 RepID=UPI000CA01DC7|nr:DNA-binding response regulator [Actinoalloteichus sp. AHMU CJ021]